MFAILKTTDIAKYLVARHFFRKERWVRNLARENRTPGGEV
jgi:hypothetical protein